MEQRSIRALIDDAPDKLYSTTYVAEMFSVTQATVRNWIKTGVLDSVRVGSHYRVPRRVLLVFADHWPCLRSPEWTGRS